MYLQINKYITDSRISPEKSNIIQYRKCWRTIKNYTRTLDHEKLHKENYIAIARIVDGNYPTKFGTIEDCEKNNKEMKDDFIKRANDEAAHNQKKKPGHPKFVV